MYHLRRGLKAFSGQIQNSTVCKNYRPPRISFSFSVANGAPGSFSEGLGKTGRRERVYLIPGEPCTVPSSQYI